MKKKLLSLMLAMSLVLTMFSGVEFTAFAVTDYSNVESLEIEPVSIIENTHGYYVQGYDSSTGGYKQYYRYDYFSNSIKGTITFNDGTDPISVRGGYSFYYDDDWTSLSISYSQNYQNRWELGGTYEIEVSALGKTVTVPVTIVPSPVESIEIEPISIVENTCGYYTSGYDSSTNEYKEYFYYSNFASRAKGRITFSDGTEPIVINGSSFYYNDEYTSISFSSSQNYENRWIGGGTYEITISTLCKTVTVPVTIIPNPVESIEIEPISFIENTGGSYDSGYDSSTGEYKQYYRYSLWNSIKGKIIFNDGTEPIDVQLGYSFDYNGESYSLSCDNTQSYQNQWTVGGIYEVKVSGLGKTVSVPVTITPSPVESIEIDPISFVDNMDGSYRQGYDSSTGEYKSFYYYDSVSSKINGRITFNDGTEPIDVQAGNSFDYNGESYSLSYDYTQNYENQWVLGGTYEVKVSVLGKTVTVPVTITPSPVESVEIEPISLVESIHGYYAESYDHSTDEYKRYYCYDFWNHIKGTITFNDGTEPININGSGFYYNDKWQSISYSHNQSYENLWTAGETYYVTIKTVGKTISVPVTITPSPVESVEIEPISIIENTKGNYDQYYDSSIDEYKKYYRYNFFYYLKGRITFNDGTEPININGNGFHYKGEYYSISYDYYAQSYQNPWTAGETYQTDITVLGKTVTVPVTIVPSPVESLEIEPVSIIENSSGYYASHYNPSTGEDEEYYYYNNFGNRLKGKITFNDGTKPIDIRAGYNFNYNGESYWISYDYKQGYENRWILGGTYDITVSALGKTVTVPVTIVPSPVESLEIEPVSIIENSSGYYASHYNPSTGEDEEYYYYNNFGNRLKGKITFNDGTKPIDIRAGYNFNYNGEYYSVSYSYNQSYENRWTVGETYEVKVSALGKTVTVPVTITPSPVESIELETIRFIENAGGYYESEYDPSTGENNKYYYYNSVWGRLKGKITFNDGTKPINISGSGFNYKGEYISISCDYNQDYENRWTAGGTYEVKISALGKTVSVPVTIVPSPVESLELEPVSIIENTNGSNIVDYDPSTGKSVTYYRYSLSNLKGKVTFNDGTNPEEIYGSGFNYKGERINISTSDNQSYQNQWVVGETYYVEVKSGSKTATVPVTIVPSPIESLEIEPISIIENTGGYYSEFYDPASGKYKEYYRYSISSDLIDGKVTFNDGTGPASIRNGFYYNGVWQYIYTSEYQSSENPWTVGGTYEITISVLGKTATVPVTIVPSPVESIEIEPISVTENINCYYTSSYDSSIGKYRYYYRYNSQNLIKGKVTFDDGTKPANISDGGFNYNGKWISISISDDQSYDNQWTVGGTYEVEIAALGKTVTVPVTVKPTNIDSLEVLKHKLNSDHSLKFTYRINYKDGTSIVNCYDETQYSDYTNRIREVTVTDWSPSEPPEYPYAPPYAPVTGGSNWNYGDTVYVSIGRINTSFVIDGGSDSGYSYVEQDGGLYITDCFLDDEDLVIPSEIDGIPVKGIMGLGNAVYSAKNVTIPDSVVFLSENLFNVWNLSIQNLYIGAGVSNITADMFIYGGGIDNIEISENNPNYTCVDGVIYDKELKTVIYYPLSKGSVYDVPDSVIDVDIFYEYPEYYNISLNFSENSKAVIVEDGITYSADKTKVLACDSEKTGDYVMPDTVTEILKGAFLYSNLSSVDISDNVTEIVYQTFAFSSIENVKLPKNLKTICEQAFRESSLKSLTLPDGLEEIGQLAFASNQIESLAIPASVTKIDYGAFEYNELSKVTIPDIQINMAYGVFRGCNNLKTAGPIGGGYDFEFGFKTAIPPYVFSGTAITSVQLPNSLITIGESAFENSDLQSVIIPGNVKTIGNYAFSETSLESVVIPDSVETIGNGSFSTYTLKNITLGKNLTTIGDYAFEGCQISEIVFNEKLSSIGKYAFYRTNLEKLNLPETVTEITYGAFAGSNLTEVTIPHGLKKISNSAFEFTSWYDSLPDGYYNEYLLYAISSDYNSPNNVTDYTVRNGTTVIADMAFQDMTRLKTVHLPEGLITIGDQAFFDCSSLTSINIPASVEYIGFDSFEGCTSLSEITVDPNNQYYTLENNALFDKNKTVLIRCFNQSGEVFEVPDTVTRILPDAFINCNVNKIKIRNNEIELDGSSLTTYPYFDNLYQQTNGAQSSVRTIICDENSNAYHNAIDNLLDVEILAESKNIINVESTTAKAGEEFTVSVDLSNTAGFAYLELTPVYSDQLSLVKVENGNLINDFTKGKQYIWSADNNVESDGKLMTFTFTTASDVNLGQYEVGFVVRSAYDENEQAVNFIVNKGTVEIYSFIYGDANGDNIVNGQDVIRLKKYLANFDYDTGVSTVEIFDGADANGDGIINGQDVVRLKKYLANFDYDTGVSTVVLGPQN